MDYTTESPTKDQIELFELINEGTIVWANNIINNNKTSSLIPYFILKKENNKLLCFKCNTAISTSINMCNSYYFFDPKYNKKKGTWIDLTYLYTLDISDISSIYTKLDYLDLSNIQKRLQILSSRKNDFNYLLNNIKPILQVGDVFCIKNNWYYVCLDTKAYVKVCRVYRLFPDFIDDSFESVIIGGRNYYIDYDNILPVAKDEEITYKDIAFPKEISIIEKNISKPKAFRKKVIFNKKDTNISSLDYKTDIEQQKKKNFIGQVYANAGQEVVFLFERSGKYYGVDRLFYRMRPKILEIKNMNNRKIKYILTSTECYNIIDELMSNTPLSNNKNIVKLYNTFKEQFEKLKSLNTLTNSNLCKNSEYEKSDISSLAFGDILAMMPIGVEVSQPVPGKPFSNKAVYIFCKLNEKNNTIICYKGFCNSMKKFKKYEFVEFNMNISNYNVDLIIDLFSIYSIPIEKYKGYISSLSIENLNLLKKSIYILHRRKEIKNHDILSLVTPLPLPEEGDILQIKASSFYVSKICEGKIKCHHLTKRNLNFKDYVEITLNNNISYINTSPQIFDINITQYNLIGITSNNDKIAIGNLLNTLK